MWGRIARLPLFVLLIAIGALAMWIPAGYAAALRDWPVARAFFHSGSLFLIGFLLLAVVTRDYQSDRPARSYLLTVIGAYTLLPAMLAVPVQVTVAETPFLSAWFEMVSSFTTTGATLYTPEDVPLPVHLWRALVGWMGGFLILVVAVAIFAPMNLGGFEVISDDGAGRGIGGDGEFTGMTDGGARVRRFAAQILPVYVGLTLALWIGLKLAGASPLVALCHAMSTLSTSGISPHDGPLRGVAGEALIFVFLLLALSRRFLARDTFGLRSSIAARNREAAVAAVLVGGVTALLFVRHWAGAFEVAEEDNVAAGLMALWGTAFTALSFLTTTGFESAAWVEARGWSGLDSPGMVLMGLALFGGGVATTAGGVKLLRIYALYAHGQREMERLIHPSSVGGAGAIARRIRRQGAQVSWVFFMLMAMSIAVVMGALTLMGVRFESAMALTLSALTTTGPLADIALDTTGSYAALSDGARGLLAVAMVVGRLETLAFIALLNPDFWRR